MEDIVQNARTEFLRSFEWTDGHADFAQVLRNETLLDLLGPALAAPFTGQGVSAVIGVEARGFVVAALAARALHVGLILARKPGSVHPASEIEIGETPDWRGRQVELRISPKALKPGERLLLVDDWVETGSQARTVARLVERLGGELAGVSAVVDDTSDEMRTLLGLVGIVRSRELPAT